MKIYLLVLKYIPSFVIFFLLLFAFFAISYMQWLYETDIVILVYTLFHVFMLVCQFSNSGCILICIFFSTLPVSKMWCCLELYQCPCVQCDAAVNTRVTYTCMSSNLQLNSSVTSLCAFISSIYSSHPSDSYLLCSVCPVILCAGV